MMVIMFSKQIYSEMSTEEHYTHIQYTYIYAYSLYNAAIGHQLKYVESLHQKYCTFNKQSLLKFFLLKPMMILLKCIAVLFYLIILNYLFLSLYIFFVL